MKKKKIGILITHGTDTMAWALSFLRYSLKNLPCNIVLTGSQIPLEVAFSSSDGYENVKSSIIFLSTVKPSHIVVVFGNGKFVYGSKLDKLYKWDPNAFSGELVGKIEWDEFQYLDKRIKRYNKLNKLNRLYVIRTGGTIDMEKNEEGHYVPRGDKVVSYINQDKKLSNYFAEVSTESLEPLRDSSNLLFDDWLKLSEKVRDVCVKEGFKNVIADTSFDKNIKILYLNPFLSEKDYKKFFENGSGFVIAGYGAGNINIMEEGKYSIIKLIKKAIDSKKPVVLASQVPMEIGDFEYMTGFEPIKLGCIPGLDRSVSDCQVKLSYLLGHKEIIEEFAKKKGFDYMNLLRLCFLAGAKFRTFNSKTKYEEIFKFKIVDRNFFIGMNFEDALKQILNRQRR